MIGEPLITTPSSHEKPPLFSEGRRHARTPRSQTNYSARWTSCPQSAPTAWLPRRRSHKARFRDRSTNIAISSWLRDAGNFTHPEKIHPTHPRHRPLPPARRNSLHIHQATERVTERDSFRPDTCFDSRLTFGHEVAWVSQLGLEQLGHAPLG